VNYLAVEFPPGSDRAWLLDADMPLADTGNFRLEFHVQRRFGLVAWRAKPLQIRLSVLASQDERNDVIVLAGQ
jgi:hypothetical protein